MSSNFIKSPSLFNAAKHCSLLNLDKYRHKCIIFMLYFFFATNMTYATDVLFEYGGMTYRVVSPQDFTADLYDALTNKDIVLPEKVVYNNRELTVIGLSSTALNNSIKTNKQVNVWITPQCQYIDTPSATGGTINIYISSLTDYLSMQNSPNYKKELFYQNGDKIPSNLIIPSDITNIVCRYAFSNCSSIESYTMEECDNTMLSLPYGMFYKCTKLKSAILRPCNMSTSTFEGCTSLESIEIKGSKDYSIGQRVFYGCTKLEQINGQILGNVEQDCFNNCTSLSELSFGKGKHRIYSMKSVNPYAGYSNPTITYYGAFKNCKSLKRLNFTDTESIFNIIYGDSTSYTSGPTGYYNYYCPQNSIFYYSGGGEIFINKAKITDLKVPDNIEAIHSGALYNAALNTIDLNNVKTIKSYAIYGCGLQDIYIPATVETIQTTGIECVNATYEYYRGGLSGRYLTHLYIKNCGGISGLQNCKELQSVHIDYLGGNISSNTFSGCSNLNEFNCMACADYISIGSYAFASTANLKYIKIPEGVTKIDELAFSSSGIETLEFSSRNQVKIIASYYDAYKTYNVNYGAFTNCTSLRKLIINGGPITVSYYYGYSPYPWLNSNIRSICFGDNEEICNVDFFITGYGSAYIEGARTGWIGVKSELDSISVGYKTKDIIINGGKTIKYNQGSRTYSWTFSYDKSQISYVEIRNPIPPNVTGGFSDWTFVNATLRVPKDALETYKTNSYWGQFWNIEGVEFESDIWDTQINDCSTNPSISFHRINEFEIVLSNCAHQSVLIYDIKGKIVFKTSSYNGIPIEIPKGIYIIKCGDKTKKTIF